MDGGYWILGIGSWAFAPLELNIQYPISNIYDLLSNQLLECAHGGLAAK